MMGIAAPGEADAQVVGRESVSQQRAELCNGLCNANEKRRLAYVSYDRAEARDNMYHNVIIPINNFDIFCFPKYPLARR